MKRSVYNLAIMVALFTGLTACNKYLDIKPDGKALLTTYSDYNKLLNDASQNLFSNADVLFLSDNAWINEIAIIGRDPGILHITFLFDESLSRFPFLRSGPNGLYSQCYEAIARHNIILQNLGKATGGTEEQRRVLLAEARTLRAFVHFLLINVYAKPYNAATAKTDGGICIKKEFNLEVLEKQSTVEEVYGFIENELKASVTDLALQTENAYHPSRAFGYAMLAKLYLFKGAFAQAKEAAKQSLEANSYIYDLVKYYQDGQKELVDIAMPENTFYAIVGGDFYAPQNGIISKEMHQSFGDFDVRKLAFFSTTAPAVQVGSGCAAFIKTPNGASRFCYNTGGIKTTEVYLMLAECLAREGNISGAMDELNKVRVKRILPAGYKAATAATPKEAVQLVIEERRKELLLGFNRFWDQRRLSLEPDYAITVVRKFPVLNTTVPQQTYTLKPNSHLYVLPFDRSVILNNPNIRQNTSDAMDF